MPFQHLAFPQYLFSHLVCLKPTAESSSTERENEKRFPTVLGVFLLKRILCSIPLPFPSQKNFLLILISVFCFNLDYRA